MSTTDLIFHTLVLILSGASAYNLSPQAAQIISDPLRDAESLFGYSIALQTQPLRLLIGAPNSFSRTAAHRNINRPGAVYEGLFGDGKLLTFRELVIEQFAEENNDTVNYLDRKEYSWIGGTIETTDFSQKTVVCGSRWKNQYFTDYYLMNGVCYALSNSPHSSADQKLLPLIDRKKQGGDENDPKTRGLFNYAYGQAGFSAHITPSMELILGAPGVMQWTGTVLAYKNHTNGKFNEPFVPNPTKTDEMAAEIYFGYTVTSGNFFPNTRLYAASAPRALNYHGVVYIFQFPNSSNEESPFDIKLRLKGQQMGGYFGAAICALDVNNNTFDDLLVGAPLSKNDAGVAYLYLDKDLLRETPTIELHGAGVLGGRFGSAISAIGDIDLDGFIDVAIGAPYEVHEESMGAVYIYRGSKTGLHDVPSQRIIASVFKPRVRGFGISISRGVDLDQNHIPDIAIGAHESGHAIILPSRPVAMLTARIPRDVRKIQQSSKEFIIRLCFTVDGKRIPPFLEIVATITADEIHRRVYFPELNGHTGNITFNLALHRELCKNLTATLRPSETWSRTSQFAAIPLTLAGRMANVSFCPFCPILDPKSNSSVALKIPVSLPCDKHECNPVWKLSADFNNMTEFIVGSKESLPLHIIVGNEGDSAHIQSVNVYLPEHVRLRTIPSTCDKGELKGVWICLPGFLINSGAEYFLDLNLDVSELDSEIIQVNISAHSFDSEDITQIDAKLHILRISRVGLMARASPSIFVIPQVNKTREKLPLLSISHNYQAYCSGFTTVPRIDMELVVPSRIRFGVAWHKLLLLTVTSSLGNSTQQCNISESSPPFQAGSSPSGHTIGAIKPSLSCGTDDIECTTISCSGGPLHPRSDGYHVQLKMEVSSQIIGALIEDQKEVLLNTTAIVKIPMSPTTILKGAATIFAGPVMQKEDPLFWLYITVAVIIGVILLSIIIWLLFKIGFFGRNRVIQTEEAVVLSSDPGMESKIESQQ